MTKMLQFKSSPTFGLAAKILADNDIPYHFGAELLSFSIALSDLNSAVSELSVAQIWTCESFKGPADYEIV